MIPMNRVNDSPDKVVLPSPLNRLRDRDNFSFGRNATNESIAILKKENPNLASPEPKFKKRKSGLVVELNNHQI